MAYVCFWEDRLQHAHCSFPQCDKVPPTNGDILELCAPSPTLSLHSRIISDHALDVRVMQASRWFLPGRDGRQPCFHDSRLRRPACRRLARWCRRSCLCQCARRMYPESSTCVSYLADHIRRHTDFAFSPYTERRWRPWYRYGDLLRRKLLLRVNRRLWSVSDSQAVLRANWRMSHPRTWSYSPFATSKSYLAPRLRPILTGCVRSTPWKRVVSYDVPANMPACPPGGCMCAWGWYDSPYSIHRSFISLITSPLPHSIGCPTTAANQTCT